jgi:uncharacterized protein (DUF1499 family)
MPITNGLMDRLGMFGRLLRLPVAPPAPPATLGVTDGRLAPCPRRPNCVSSLATDAVHGMPPIPGRDGGERTLAHVLAVVSAEPGARVVERRAGYVRAEFTTAVWRFVDDAEFLWDDAGQVVHFRSASRIGRSDLGANRRRMERIARLVGEG